MSTKYRMRECAYQMAENKGISFAEMPDAELMAFSAGITFGLRGACEIMADLIEKKEI